MSMQAENPRAVTGSNEAPDYAAQVTDRMALDYAETARNVEALLQASRDLPKEVSSDADVGIFSALIVKLRDQAVRIKAFHGKEKEPYLRGGEAVDQFFFRLFEKLTKRNKNDPNGAVEVLTGRVHVYQTKKLEEERRKRAAAEAEAQRIADEAAAKRRAEEEKQREAEAAAARARRPEKIAELEQQAVTHAINAEAARNEETASRQNLSDARVAATTKPADLVRTRTDEGNLATMKQEPFVEITDAMQLDHAVLWAFVKDEHKLAALKAWAKITQHKTQMKGAIIEMRDATVIR